MNGQAVGGSPKLINFPYSGINSSGHHLIARSPSYTPEDGSHVKQAAVPLRPPSIAGSVQIPAPPIGTQYQVPGIIPFRPSLVTMGPNGPQVVTAGGNTDSKGGYITSIMPGAAIPSNAIPINVPMIPSMPFQRPSLTIAQSPTGQTILLPSPGNLPPGAIPRAGVPMTSGAVPLQRPSLQPQQRLSFTSIPPPPSNFAVPPPGAIAIQRPSLSGIQIPPPPPPQGLIAPPGAVPLMHPPPRGVMMIVQPSQNVFVPSPPSTEVAPPPPPPALITVSQQDSNGVIKASPPPAVTEEIMESVMHSPQNQACCVAPRPSPVFSNLSPIASKEDVSVLVVGERRPQSTSQNHPNQQQVDPASSANASHNFAAEEEHDVSTPNDGNKNNRNSSLPSAPFRPLSSASNRKNNPNTPHKLSEPAVILPALQHVDGIPASAASSPPQRRPVSPVASPEGTAFLSGNLVQSVSPAKMEDNRVPRPALSLQQSNKPSSPLHDDDLPAQPAAESILSLSDAKVEEKNEISNTNSKSEAINAVAVAHSHVPPPPELTTHVITHVTHSKALTSTPSAAVDAANVAEAKIGAKQESSLLTSSSGDERPSQPSSHEWLGADLKGFVGRNYPRLFLKVFEPIHSSRFVLNEESLPVIRQGNDESAVFVRTLKRLPILSAEGGLLMVSEPGPILRYLSHRFKVFTPLVKQVDGQHAASNTLPYEIDSACELIDLWRRETIFIANALSTDKSNEDVYNNCRTESLKFFNNLWESSVKSNVNPSGWFGGAICPIAADLSLLGVLWDNAVIARDNFDESIIDSLNKLVAPFKNLSIIVKNLTNASQFRHLNEYLQELDKSITTLSDFEVACSLFTKHSLNSETYTHSNIPSLTPSNTTSLSSPKTFGNSNIMSKSSIYPRNQTISSGNIRQAGSSQASPKGYSSFLLTGTVGITNNHNNSLNNNKILSASSPSQDSSPSRPIVNFAAKSVATQNLEVFAGCAPTAAAPLPRKTALSASCRVGDIPSNKPSEVNVNFGSSPPSVVGLSPVKAQSADYNALSSPQQPQQLISLYQNIEDKVIDNQEEEAFLYKEVVNEQLDKDLFISDEAEVVMERRKEKDIQYGSADLLSVISEDIRNDNCDNDNTENIDIIKDVIESFKYNEENEIKSQFSPQSPLIAEIDSATEAEKSIAGGNFFGESKSRLSSPSRDEVVVIKAASRPPAVSDFDDLQDVPIAGTLKNQKTNELSA